MNGIYNPNNNRTQNSEVFITSTLPAIPGHRDWLQSLPPDSNLSTAVQEIKNVVDQLESSKNLNEVLNNPKVEVQIVETEMGALGGIEIRDGKIIIELSKNTFQRIESELTMEGLSKEEVRRRSVLLMAPILAHEYRHAQDRLSLENQGTPFNRSSEESEILGWAQGALAWNEIKKQNPELRENQTSFANKDLDHASNLWDKGIDELRAQKLNSFSLTNRPYEDVKRDIDLEVSQVEEVIEQRLELEKELTLTPPGSLSQKELQQKLNNYPSEVALAEQLKEVIEDRKTFEKYSAIKLYYEKELKKLYDIWKSEKTSTTP